MGDRYTLSETSQPQESWPSDFNPKDLPVLEPQAEFVYEAARDVLVETGMPHVLAVAMAEAIRKRVLGL